MMKMTSTTTTTNLRSRVAVLCQTACGVGWSHYAFYFPLLFSDVC